MEMLRKTTSLLGSILIAALVLAVLAPKTVHGVAAALVQVSNTPANPIPNRDVDNAPRQAVTLVAGGLSGSSAFALVGSPTVPFVVPAGKRLVIEYVSGTVITDPAAQVREVAIEGQVSTSSSPGNFLSFLQSNLSSNETGVRVNIVAQKTWIYVDAGTSPSIGVELSTGSPSTNFTLQGYLLDCSSGCSVD